MQILQVLHSVQFSESSNWKGYNNLTFLKYYLFIFLKRSILEYFDFNSSRVAKYPKWAFRSESIISYGFLKLISLHLLNIHASCSTCYSRVVENNRPFSPSNKIVSFRILRIMLFIVRWNISKWHSHPRKSTSQIKFREVASYCLEKNIVDI